MWADMSHMEVVEVVVVLAGELAQIDNEDTCPSGEVPESVRRRMAVQVEAEGEQHEGEEAEASDCLGI